MAACHHTREELASSLGGMLDSVPVLREFLKAQRARLRATIQERNSLVLWVACLIPCLSCASSSKERGSLMAAVAEPLLITVEQYRQLPECDDLLQELHWGQLITLTRPKARHVKLQSRLVRLLRPQAEHLGYIESELPFRALPEYDLRAADVAFVSKQRWDEVPDDQDLRGAPELVIEVLSRSNTPAKIQERKGHDCVPPHKVGTRYLFGWHARFRACFARVLQKLAALCLSAGTHELWVIDAKRETVTITSRQGVSMVYGPGDRIPLSLFGGDLAVSEIFARA